MPPAHAACLAMLAPVFTLQPDGRRIYEPGGQLLDAGDRLEQPGLARALEALAAEGAAAVYRGTLAEALVDGVPGVAVTRADLARYDARWLDPVEVSYAGTRFLTRAGLSAVPATLAKLPRLRGIGAGERLSALVAALTGTAGGGHTTNLVASDRDGCACVLTTSLGLGTGDFLPGYDVQLNSMLGEVDLLRGPLEPGQRMESMMAPSLALARDGPVLAIGSAGGTRLRTALVTVAAGVLDEGLAVDDAVRRARVHPAGSTVHAEPAVDEDGLARLEAHGWSVRRWPAQHHYFGGVSAITRTDVAGDPRRSGGGRRLR
jgi:gamma-glutamyltranspeptidase/glutathione hydrolase